MTLAEAKKIIKSECYIADLLNLDRTQMVNTALDTVIEAAEKYAKIADMLEGTIDHLNGDDAKDLLVDIKWEVRGE